MLQKPLAYRLLSFAFLLVLGSWFLALSSCRSNPNIQGRGEAYLQGEWQQQKDAVQEQLLTYTLYHLNFDCDSFRVRFQTFSKVNYGADTCMRTGRWTEYAKGSYEQYHDTLRLKGFFCDARYRLKNDKGCFRSGIYDETFKLTISSPAAVQLQSTSSVVPIHLQLIKRTTCHPKPL